MGPLVPDIIGNELNFVTALFIGIAFGFILEQAGFSTSKKLVGLFYGYDFTVLRVFFTAGVTAMLGVLTLGHFGLLDVNLIYINPTFLWSAITGGFIMGLGFVLGGFCPGTGICAAAIGKIDAMIYTAGMFIGVFVFAEGYPLFESLYKAENWGFARIFDTLGISQGLFAFILTGVALAAFWFTSLLENKVNGKPNPEFKPLKLYYALTGAALIAGLSAFFLPDIRDSYTEDIHNAAYVNSYNINKITTDELAFRIIDKDKRIHLIDLRKADDYNKLSLPMSNNFTLESLFDRSTERLLNTSDRINIFIADDEFTARQGAVLAVKLGYENILVLEGGLNKFKEDIINFTPLPEATGREISSYLSAEMRQQKDTYRFRTKAAVVIPILIKENKTKAVPKKESKRVLGGC